MTIHHCDQALTTGTDAGTSWANAYKTLLTAAANAAAGDIIYVKGTSASLTQQVVDFASGLPTNPIICLGVKSATTNEDTAIVQSDLIPGWMTGETRTEANRAYIDTDSPLLLCTNGSANIFIRGGVYMYGVRLHANASISIADLDTDYVHLEECFINYALTVTGNWISGSASSIQDAEYKYKNCSFGFTANNSSFANWKQGIIGSAIGLTANTSQASLGYWASDNTSAGHEHFYGCDLSDFAHTIFGVTRGQRWKISNSKLHASSALTSGVIAAGRAEAYQCDSSSGLTSGNTVTAIDIMDMRGTIVEETTAYRTGGATDGTTPWSLAFTPNVDDTRDQYLGLEGPWMGFEVTSGTSKTVTVYIANSGAADYNDDDVWLDLMYPSELGTAQFDHQTTQMKLLGTPTAVADDTGSTWGTGGNNHQKLVATISPDYTGLAYCRVVFAKHFASSPETLYVDPLPEYA